MKFEMHGLFNDYTKGKIISLVRKSNNSNIDFEICFDLIYVDLKDNVVKHKLIHDLRLIKIIKV